MRYLFAAPLAALALAGCASGIPTPGSIGAPTPDAVLLVPSPAALPTAELCAYVSGLEAAVIEWQDYYNSWSSILGRDPVFLADLVGAQEEAVKALEIRAAACPD
jgi:hypothetical protein